MMRARYGHQIHMSTSFCPPEGFSELTNLFKGKIFSALEEFSLTYDDFLNLMVEQGKKEQKKTKEHNTSASWQLSWIRSIVGDNPSDN